MTPLIARACKIPTDAEEDWISAVNPAPTRIPSRGLLNLVISSTNCGSSLNGDMAELIMSIPMNRTPMPATIPAICWSFLFFTKTRIATPIKAISGARAPISSAISWPVMVVPILAPIITQTAWFKVMSPELTKPTTITVVAEEDWISAVITAPTRTPKKRLEVRRSKICFILLPAAASRLVLIICIP